VITILAMVFFVVSFYHKGNTAFKELRDSIDSLYDSEARNRAIISGTVDGVPTINEHGIIEIDTETDNNQFFFYIRDNGKRIPSDELSDMFDPFIKKDSNASSREEIGLTYAMYLTRHLGGSLNYQPTTEEGSLFSFSLPIQPSQSATTVQGTIKSA